MARIKQSPITKSSRGQACINCGIEDGTICARHYNGHHQHIFGKGTGKKCHDLATADLCDNCERPFSEGKIDMFLSSADRSDEFLKLCMLTNIRRMNQGVINAGSERKPVPQARSSKILPRHTVRGVHTL